MTYDSTTRSEGDDIGPVTAEFRSLSASILGPDLQDPIEGIQRIFGINHRTVERWYSGKNQPPQQILARMRKFASMTVQLEQLRTDLESVLADAIADGIPEVLVGMRMAGFGESHTQMPVERMDSDANVPEAEINVPAL